MKNELCSEIGQEVQDIVLIDYQLGSYFYLKIMQCQDLTTNSLDLLSKKIKIPRFQFHGICEVIGCGVVATFLFFQLKLELKQAEKRSWSLGWVTNL